MGMIATLREAPLVMKVAYAAFVGGILLSFVAVMTESEQRWMYAIAPAAAIVLGILLALDVGGSAQKQAEATRTQRPLGIDYSRSVLASTGFARVFGVMLAAVGGGMLFAALTQPL